jgi:hypothetical protein
MKPTSWINSLLILIISLCLFGDLNAQVMIIPDVTDLQQPIDPWWGNLPDNACAPVSAANICVYWDDSIHHSNAVGLNSRLIADSIPSFLYYFMGTNGMGDPTRANPSFYGITPGTITMDIDTGFKEYVRWDASNMFFTPKPFSIPTSKKGFDWKIERDEIMGFHLHMMEIDARRPDILVFKYWNPDTTGIAMASDMGGDSIHFFLWDTAVSTTDFPHPHEDWYFDEKPNSAGHAVTGVGYLFGWDPDEGGPLPLTDWIICHDNWATTPVNVAIPWVDSIWISTFTADPGTDTILPYISCVDTTVYLDGNGQFHIDESYIVDSAWDNNGVDQLFLDDYYLLCPYTLIPKTITATAMDMFGNMAHCIASVTVLDTIGPIPVCTDTTVYLDLTGNVTIDSTYVNDGSTDNCGITSISLSDDDFTCNDIGANNITITLLDVSGNSEDTIVEVLVLDTISPVLICTDTTVYLDASGTFTIDSTYLLVDASDNCGNSSAFLSRTDFDTTDLGSLQPVFLTVHDASGNSSTCQVSITVLDTVTSSVDNEIMYDNNFEFIINPNPSDGIIIIENKSPVQYCMLEIYNISGALLLKKNLYNVKNELDISNFNKGVYVVKVKGKGGREYRDRIIIR